jgi:hypothetical protein
MGWRKQVDHEERPRCLSFAGDRSIRPRLILAVNIVAYPDYLEDQHDCDVTLNRAGDVGDDDSEDESDDGSDDGMDQGRHNPLRPLRLLLSPVLPDYSFDRSTCLCYNTGHERSFGRATRRAGKRDQLVKVGEALCREQVGGPEIVEHGEFLQQNAQHREMIRGKAPDGNISRRAMLLIISSTLIQFILFQNQLYKTPQNEDFSS